ncbi:MAG TPA: glycosyltransferase family 4 protein [Puia sp.]|nr:glycosyltransferase family 4 protein [Puia sp.]
MKLHHTKTGISILEMNFERNWRGGERQTLYTMIGFKNAGFHVSLLCKKNSELDIRAKHEGFKTFGFNNIFSAFFFLVFKCRKYNVLHAQTSHILTYAVLSKIFNGAKIIFTRRIFKIPTGVFTKWKYKRTDKIVAISPAVQKVMEDFTEKNVLMISDIVIEKKLDAQRAKKLVEELNIKTAAFILGTTAALTKEKAPVVMIETIRLLRSKRKDFVFLHFGTGELETGMKKLVEEYDLANVYYLVGFKENVEDFFSILNVFVMSSELEGLGSSVLDAFMYKVPVVSTDAGGLHELLQDGRGILCKKNSPELLASGIEQLLANPEMIANATDKAFEYVKQFHSLEYITKQYANLIEEL